MAQTQTQTQTQTQDTEPILNQEEKKDNTDHTEKQPDPIPEPKETSKEKRPWIHTTLETASEQIFRWIFFWETDEKRLGTLIRFLHHSVAYILLLLYIMIHTLYPSFFLLCIFQCMMILIWLQHIFTGGCVVNKIERKMLGDSRSFFDPILHILNMETTDNNTEGITKYTSTIVVGMTGMEIVARVIQSIKTFFFH